MRVMVLIKRNEHAKLLTAINQFYKPQNNDTKPEIKLIAQQLQDGIRLVKDIKMSSQKIRFIVSAIQYVYKMPFGEFIKERTITEEIKFGSLSEENGTNTSLIINNTNQIWEATYCNFETGQEVVMNYNCEPRTQYLKSECKKYGVDLCIVRVK
ncbi:hypothetical protein [Brevibacillus sp. NRS-1366]|uniref:hypothetical protein n=1 Tax=Brevibacillus sp. NRS-1366 TaxID=3233899 RepID=UPI003D1BB544